MSGKSLSWDAANAVSTSRERGLWQSRFSVGGASGESKNAVRKRSGEYEHAYANRRASGESQPEAFAIINASSWSILI